MEQQDISAPGFYEFRDCDWSGMKSDGSANIYSDVTSPTKVSTDLFGPASDWEIPDDPSQLYRSEQSVSLDESLLTLFPPPVYNFQEDDAYLNDDYLNNDDCIKTVLSRIATASPTPSQHNKAITQTNFASNKEDFFVTPEIVARSNLNVASALDAAGSEKTDNPKLKDFPDIPPQVIGDHSVSIPKAKRSRKSSHTPRAVSKSSEDELRSTNGMAVQVGVVARDLDVQIKQEWNIVPEDTKKKRHGKKRLTSASASTAVAAGGSDNSQLEPFGKFSSVFVEPSTNAPTKKLKMYHKVDDPKCRNAYIARINREKKKKELLALTEENQRIKAENDKLKREKDIVTAELLQLRQLNTSFVGLQRLFPSVSTMMTTIMKSLEQSSGKWVVRSPPWFDNVPVPTSNVAEFGDTHASLADNFRPTSKYITLHVNPIDRIVQMDYTPEEPNVLHHSTPS